MGIEPRRRTIRAALPAAVVLLVSVLLGVGPASATSHLAAPQAGSPLGEAVPAGSARSQIREAFLCWLDTKPRTRVGPCVQHWDEIKDVAKRAAEYNGNTVGYHGRVESITIDGPRRATVTYSILNGDSLAVPNEVGHAVKTDRVWKVSRQTVCDAFKLGGPGSPQCEDADNERERAAASKVRVLVLNGSPIDQADATMANYLTEAGYPIAGIDTTEPRDTTEIACRKGHADDARALADAVEASPLAPRLALPADVVAFPKPVPRAAKQARCILQLAGTDDLIAVAQPSRHATVGLECAPENAHLAYAPPEGGPINIDLVPRWVPVAQIGSGAFAGCMPREFAFPEIDNGAAVAQFTGSTIPNAPAPVFSTDHRLVGYFIGRFVPIETVRQTGAVSPDVIARTPTYDDYQASS